MKKNIILPIMMILLMLGLGITPIADGQTVTSSESPLSPMNTITLNKFQSLLGSLRFGGDKRFGNGNDTYSITPEDEGDHFPSGFEYWFTYMMLNLEDGRQWDMCGIFFYIMNWTGKQWSETDGQSYLRIQSWDRETGKSYDYLHLKKHPGVLQHKKNIVDLKFYNSTMKGLYPNYKACFHNDIDNIILSVDLHASSPYYQHYTEIVNGTLPIGTGSFQYFSIPFIEIKGNISINGTIFNVTGVGYHEHQFGDAHLESGFRFTSLKDLLKVGSLYTSLVKWLYKPRSNNWLKETHLPCISIDKISGYDWVWAAFDNGWSMIFQRIRARWPFGFAEGPCHAIIMLTDGKRIWEFSDVYFKTKQDKYFQESGLYVPLDLEITGFKEDMSISIVFNHTTEMTKMNTRFTQIGSAKGELFLVSGNITGYFKDGEKKVALNGQGTNTPFLLIPKMKYKSLEIELLLPPDGLGISIRKLSLRLGIERFLKIQLRPFEFEFYIKPAPGT